MIKNTDGFFENNLFHFKNCSCDCVEDIHHTMPGQPVKRTLKIQAVPSKPIHFAFSAGEKGLVRLGPKQALIEDNILGKLISICPGDTGSLFDFFKKNGFFFDISDTEYEPIDASLIFELINRIKATVELMSALGAIRRNYDDILRLTLYLLLSEPVMIAIPSLLKPFTTCKHTFLNTIKNASSLPVIDRRQEAFDKDTYSIVDTIYPPVYDFDIGDYNDIRGGYMTSKLGSDNPLFKNVVDLYCNCFCEGSQIRCIIDFLFHYEYEVGIIKTISYSSIDYYTAPDTTKFNTNLKKALIDIAEIVVSEEINSNLDGIHPQYDTVKMAPSWKIDTLIAALYFSIFYLKPDLQLYRRCANPSCGTYFLVNTTSTRRKYCNPDCCNRMQQRNNRKKKRAERERRERME